MFQDARLRKSTRTAGEAAKRVDPKAQCPTLIAASLVAAMSAAQAQDAAAPPADAASAVPASQAASDPEAQPARRPDGSGELQQVVVTAEKRGSTIQKTPISMSAVTADELQQRGVTSVRELMNDIPGVAMKSQGAGQTELVIRGLSSAAGVSPTVGFYLDEVPVAPPTTATAGKTGIDPNLYDLARVEVLRGPQGTLYGASSMGGTVRLITAAADAKKFEGSAQATASFTQGGGANGEADVMVNVPLERDVAALRLVATQKHDSGWIDRVVVPGFPLPSESNGVIYGTVRGQVADVAGSQVHRDVNQTDLTSMRAELLLKPSSSLTIRPSVLFQAIRQGGPDEYDSKPGTEAHYQPFDIAESFRDRFTLSSLAIDYDFGPATLVSATGFTQRQRRQVQDISETVQNLFALPAFDTAGGGAGPASIAESDPTRQFSQELRLASKGDGPWTWMVGSFYSRLSSHYQAVSLIPGLADLFGTENLYTTDTQDTLSQFALFANTSYRITPDLKVTVGLRHFSSNDRSHIVSSGLGSAAGGDTPETDASSASANGYNPMVNLSYDLSNDNMVYATAAKGFRDGAAQAPVPTTGINATCAADLARLGLTASPLRYGPDSVWSYEFGSKNRLLDNRMTLNSSVYMEDWSKVQQSVGLDCGWTYTANAGNARVYGAEVELTARVGGGFTFEQGLSYTHAAFSEDYPLTNTKKGDLLQGVPMWNSSTALSLDRSINDDYSFTGRLSADYVGSSYNVTSSRVRLPGYALANLRLGLAADTWQATFFINNLTNRRVQLEATPSLVANVPTYDRISTNRPRTTGVTLSKTF